MLKIEYTPVSTLKTHERNPRKIDEEDFERLKKSIIDNPDFFEVRPILATSTGRVFAGNMRLRAALAIGMEEVPVAIMDVTPERERELMIRDNVANGKWDYEILGADFEAAELEAYGVDTSDFGTPSFKPSGSDGRLDEGQKWVYTCDKCGEEHIFTKSDLKPYDPGA